MHFNAELFKKFTFCEIRTDPISKVIYSSDASIYEIKPLGIAIPKNQDELSEVIAAAKSLNIPLIPRGAATGITGGCLGSGLIVDLTHLNKLHFFDKNQRQVICDPGLIQDDLNRFLAPHHLRLGPDTSTGNVATLGGMVANHAAGAYSPIFGTMIDAVQAIDLTLSSHHTIHLSEVNEKQWHEKLKLNNEEGAIYRTCHEIRKNNHQEITKHFHPIPRRASGYPLDQLISPFPINLAKLIVGSEGSLGIIRSMTLSLVDLPTYREVVLIGFKTMQEAMQAIPKLLELKAAAIELIDDKILNAGIASPFFHGKLQWLVEIPKALLILEFHKPQTPINGSFSFINHLYDLNEIDEVFALRKAGLGLLLSKRSYTRALAFIEDISIPPHQLAPFMDRFLNYLSMKGKDAGIYGHAASGCLHIRPYINLRDPADVALMKSMMQDIVSLVLEFGGAMSGEHGDGIIRSWLNPLFFGPTIYPLFEEIKKAFDPLGLMNPHKIVNPLPVDQHLRNSPLSEPTTFLSFKSEGGIALSSDLCNNNGLCRKKDGVMCPSFQVTQDEYDTTRARAHVMQDIMKTGSNKTLADDSLHEILDLCIQCKGCKTECPSHVDMAKMKSEALFHFSQKNGYPLRSLIFGYVDFLNQVFYPLRKIYNSFLPSSLIKKALRMIGITGNLPLFAKERFSEAIKKVEQPKGNSVILLSDTYTEFYCPEIGMAAVKVLNHLGYHVIVPPWQCCGRPAISKGILKHAKSNVEKTIQSLIPYLKENLPIIGLEPSCHLTFLDEFEELLNPKEKSRWMLFDTFISQHSLESYKESYRNKKGTVALHIHCHQKALLGSNDTLKALKKTGIEIIEIPSGCCGMAGSFGHEVEHEPFSKKIGELVLLPFIRKLPKEVLVIANGFSCRSQIKNYTDRKPYHLAEIFADLSL